MATPPSFLSPAETDSSQPKHVYACTRQHPSQQQQSLLSDLARRNNEAVQVLVNNEGACVLQAAKMLKAAMTDFRTYYRSQRISEDADEISVQRKPDNSCLIPSLAAPTTSTTCPIPLDFSFSSLSNDEDYICTHQDVEDHTVELAVKNNHSDVNLGDLAIAQPKNDHSVTHPRPPSRLLTSIDIMPSLLQSLNRRSIDNDVIRPSSLDLGGWLDGCCLLDFYNRALVITEPSSIKPNGERIKKKDPEQQGISGDTNNDNMEQEERLRQELVCAVLLYNMALLWQSRGLANGKSRYLLKASAMYRLSLTLLDSKNKEAMQEQDCNAASAHVIGFACNERERVQGMNVHHDDRNLLQLAILNNLAHIDSYLFAHDAVLSHVERMQRIFEQLNQWEQETARQNTANGGAIDGTDDHETSLDETTLSLPETMRVEGDAASNNSVNDEYSWFYQNVTLALWSTATSGGSFMTLAPAA